MNKNNKETVLPVALFNFIKYYIFYSIVKGSNLYTYVPFTFIEL